MKNKIKTIIFDFDGVIGDSFNCVCEIIYKNCCNYTKHNLTLKKIKYEIRNTNLFEIIKKYKIKKIFIPLIVFKIKYDLKKRISKTKIFPQIKVTLKRLKNKNIKLAF